MPARALIAVAVLGAAVARPVSAAEPAWSPNVYDYDRPARFEVREAPESERGRFAGSVQRRFVFRGVKGQDVPVLVTLPPGPGPFPAVVLVHGFCSSKEQVTLHVGRALLARGFACVAADLPLHGERPGPPAGLFVEDNLARTRDQVVQAVIEIRQAVDFAETRRELDTSKGVGLVGYSMGGWLAALVAGAERRVNALVLMVPVSEAARLDGPVKSAAGRGKALLERYKDLRPTGAIARLSPRPVLILAGQRDLYLPKEAAETLRAAALDPRELRIYDAGHILPDQAVQEAAQWLADRRAGPAVSPSSTTRPTTSKPAPAARSNKPAKKPATPAAPPAGRKKPR